MFPHFFPLPTPLASLFATRSPVHVALGFFPSLYFSLTRYTFGTILLGCGLFTCLFIVYSIGWHYMMAITVPPGSVLEGLGDEAREQRKGPGSTVWWARMRARAELAGAHTGAAQSHSISSSSAAASTLERRRPDYGRNGHFPFERTTSGKGASEASDSWIGTSSPLASPLSIRNPVPPSSSGDFADTSSAVGSSRRPMREVAQAPAGVERNQPLARMCHKCPPVPLTRALLALPPSLRRAEKELRRPRHRRPASPSSSSPSHSPSPARANGSGNLYRDCETMRSNQQGGEDSDSDDSEGATESAMTDFLGNEEATKLVPPPKPERTHHCSVCKTCVLKFVSGRVSVVEADTALSGIGRVA